LTIVIRLKVEFPITTQHASGFPILRLSLEDSMKRIWFFFLLTFILDLPLETAENGLARCLTRGQGESIKSAVMKNRPTRQELLARLVYAEGLSTGFPDDTLVYQAIAWGVMNRVRLGEASATLRRRYGSGIAGVIFRQGQFNPALSTRSPFSKEFLCPHNSTRWQMAMEAAERALQGHSNPFLQTAWEKTHGLSLVVNFYYPRSIQAHSPLPPWEGSRELKSVGDVVIDGVVLSAKRIRFYRLTNPPKDI
jgi:hypothetical protein